MTKNTKFGVLYIVATPIGNLQDISKRALSTLSKVDLCAAEDTRKSKVLLDKYNLEKKLISYHKFSEKKKLELLISFLRKGKNIALISDSGTPLISDPGYLLVKKALEEEITVSPIPGPSSLISALSVSGISTDTFTFYGFAPRQIKAKELFIKSLIADKKTSIVFESKNRIISFIEKLSELSPDRNIFLAREMTKIHETFYKGKANQVLKKLILKKEQIKGEFVLIIEGNKEINNQLFLSNEQEEVLKVLMEKMGRKEALSLASKSFGISKNLIYKLLLEEK